MGNKIINTEQGHWILAKMGKKVLRPGGRHLTEQLVESLHITPTDSVVEFAPGMGYTAELLLSKKPGKYTGIELNEEAAGLLREKINSNGYAVFNKSAADTGLEEASVDKVMGEAMLTMQADHRKSEIIREAYRILKPGGVYAIHELGLRPDNLPDDVKKEVRQGLAKTIRVNARPLTKSEWCELLQEEGFKIKEVKESPMSLLKLQRILDDEGWMRTLKIGFNVLTHPKERKKIFNMRRTFNKYEDKMTSFGILAVK